MVVERKIENLSSKDRLEALIVLGVRDSKDQPGAPAMTLIRGMHDDLIRYVFENQGQDYSEDVVVQGEAIGAYVATELLKMREITFVVRASFFEDKKTKERGIYIFLKQKSKGAVNI